MFFQTLPIVLRRIFQVGTVSVCLLLASCAGTPREEIFDSDGPTTEQIWRGGSERSVLLAEQVGAAGGDLDSWSRSVDRELPRCSRTSESATAAVRVPAPDGTGISSARLLDGF